jgi:phosphoglycerate dehydrogenase-like enzyme
VLITINKRDLRRRLFPEECIQNLRESSDVHWVPENTPYTGEQLRKDIKYYDALITCWGSPKLTADMLARDTHRLRFIGHAAGTLVPYIDPLVFDKNIKVVNANSALARSTAEFTISLMTAGAWNLHGFQTDLRKGKWRDNSVTVMGLYRQKVGLIGFGEVSKEVIRFLQGYDAQISLYSPYCTNEEANRLGIHLCSLEELLQNNSIISLHDTLTPTTRGMIGREQLQMISDGALLINTARASIINEPALIEQLKSGRISASLDVYHHEPLPVDYELLHLPNVLCVPHIGAISGYWKSRMGELVIEDLVRFIHKESLLREITLEKFQRMTVI